MILGAGLTGLSFSYYSGRNIPLFEMESCAGGLIRTQKVGKYKFDLAPHLLHFRSETIRKLVLEELNLNVTSHTRKARIYFEKKLIPYPFELNLNQISAEIRDDCIVGLNSIDANIRSNEKSIRSGSYHDYALKAFGPGIANHYLLPYNRKIWDTDPKEMNCEWMRMLPTADLEKIRNNAFFENMDEFGYNTEFYYPSEGGMQDLADLLSHKLSNLYLKHKAVSIDVEKKVVIFENGREERYKTLISTLPLNQLVQLTARQNMIKQAELLISTAVTVVNVVVKGAVPEGVHWIYFPNKDLDFFRVSLPKNYFPNCAPDNEHIISVEVSNRKKIMDIELLEKKIIDQLKLTNVFEIKEVVFCHTDVLPSAYCIYDTARAEIVKNLSDELESFGIFSSGRYGKWEYSAMQDALTYGLELAQKFKLYNKDI